MGFEVGVRSMASKKLPWTLSSDGVAEQVREAFANLLHCSSDDIALCPSTSFSLTTAARAAALDVQPGDVGLILEDQMSSNTYPWNLVQRRCGLNLEAIPYPRDGDWNAALFGRLDALDSEGKRVAFVAVPVYLWTDGSGPVDLEALCARCHTPGRSLRTLVVVDATQSIGAVPFDLRRCPVDFLAASVHKWLFGAYGLSCLYVAPRWWNDPRLEALVEDEHPRAHMAGADDEVPFDMSLPGYPLEYQLGARRLDSGGRPNPIILPMALDGLRLVSAWGPAYIAETLAPLTARLHKRCEEELGLWVPAVHSPHFLGIGPGPLDHCETIAAASKWVQDASAHLKKNRVYVSARLKVMRVAPHLYTTMADVDRFVEVLGSFVKEGRSATLATSRL